MNVDENLAIMDANASSNAIADATNDGEARDASAEGAPDRNRSSGASPGKGSSAEAAVEQDRSTGVDAVASDDAPDQDEVGAPPNGDEETTPNAL